MSINPDAAVYLLTAVIGALGTILWFSIRSWVKGINEKITEMMSELKVVGNKNVGFEKDIARIDSNYNSHDKRMHDYSERIRDLEQKQASCRNCNK